MVLSPHQPKFVSFYSRWFQIPSHHNNQESLLIHFDSLAVLVLLTHSGRVTADMLSQVLWKWVLSNEFDKKFILTSRDIFWWMKKCDMPFFGRAPQQYSWRYLKESQSVIRANNWLILQHSYQKTLMLNMSSNEVGLWSKSLEKQHLMYLSMANHRILKVYFIFPNFLPKSPSSHQKCIYKLPWKLDRKTEQGWKEKGNLLGKL